MIRKRFDSVHGNSPYDNYFSKRGVSRKMYYGYRLPKSFEQHLPKNRSNKFLDIGCGNGQYMSALIELGYSYVHGIDISKTAIEVCKSQGLNVDHVFGIVQYRVENEGEKYDFVLMNHVLEHIPKSEIIPTLVHIRQRLLKSDGVFYVSVPNAQSPTGCYWAYEDFTHSTIFTAGSLLYVLRSAGFTQVNFIDCLGTDGSAWPIKFLKKFFIWCYEVKIIFWNKATGGAFHAPSPRIYTFDLKAFAKVARKQNDM